MNGQQGAGKATARSLSSLATDGLAPADQSQEPENLPPVACLSSLAARTRGCRAG